MPAKPCAERVNDLTAQRDQLSAHQVDLTTPLHAATPSLPVKHLLGQFIHRIEISTDWQAHPTYLIQEP